MSAPAILPRVRLLTALSLLLGLACFCGPRQVEEVQVTPTPVEDGLTLLTTLGTVDPVTPTLALDATWLYVGLWAREETQVLRLPRFGGAGTSLGSPGANIRGMGVVNGVVRVATDEGLMILGDGEPRRLGPREEWRAMALDGADTLLAAKDRLVRLSADGTVTELARWSTISLTWQIARFGDRIYYSRWGPEKEIGWLPAAGGATTVITRDEAPDAERLGLWQLDGQLAWGITIGTEVRALGDVPRTVCDARSMNSLYIGDGVAWMTSAVGTPGTIGRSTNRPNLPIRSVPGGIGGLWRCDLRTGGPVENLAPSLVKPRAVIGDSAAVFVIDSEDGRVLMRSVATHTP